MSFNDQINLFTNFSCLRILFLTFPHLVMETILILWLKLFFSRILKNWKKFLRHLSKFLLHCTKFTSTKLCIQIIYQRIHINPSRMVQFVYDYFSYFPNYSKNQKKFWEQLSQFLPHWAIIHSKIFIHSKVLSTKLCTINRESH